MVPHRSKIRQLSVQLYRYSALIMQTQSDLTSLYSKETEIALRSCTFIRFSTSQRAVCCFYCEEYWLKELQESMDRCTGRRDITALNTYNQSIIQKSINSVQYLTTLSRVIQTRRKKSVITVENGRILVTSKSSFHAMFYFYHCKNKPVIKAMFYLPST